MKKIIAEAKLVQSLQEAKLFYFDDRKRGLYMNFAPAPNAQKLLKRYVGQTLTLSVEISEESPCCSPDFEERIKRLEEKAHIHEIYKA